MKATLEFNLPDEKFDHRLAVNAFELWQTIYDLDQQLRNFLKHGPTADSPKTLQEQAERIRLEFTIPALSSLEE